MPGRLRIRSIMRRARQQGLLVPGFNIPYLPMLGPVVAALRDNDCFGLVMVARLEWTRYEAGGPGAVLEEYQRVGAAPCTRLHLDHVPVVDEDGRRVDYLSVIEEALRLGYDSVMVDGSRLPLEENLACARRVVELAATTGAAVEAELGAVLGHEAGSLPPYEELFAARRGFTVPEQAARFVGESGVDWLSVAVGNIHGAIARAGRAPGPKPRARLDLELLQRIVAACDVPLVLHGGTGIPSECVLQAARCGIAKINIATAIRNPYERGRQRSQAAAEDAVYAETSRILRHWLQVAGSAGVLLAGETSEGCKEDGFQPPA